MRGSGSLLASITPVPAGVSANRLWCPPQKKTGLSKLPTGDLLFQRAENQPLEPDQKAGSTSILKEYAMRFMIIVKATEESEAGVMPEEKLLAEMAGYHEELAKAGVLIDGSGLQSSAKGWRIIYSGKEKTIVDGPFAETKELIAGYTIIQVQSREEAMEWSRRFPNPAGDGAKGEIEVRQMFELEDFGQGDEVEGFRKIGVGGTG